MRWKRQKKKKNYGQLYVYYTCTTGQCIGNEKMLRVWEGGGELVAAANLVTLVRFTRSDDFSSHAGSCLQKMKKKKKKKKKRIEWLNLRSFSSAVRSQLSRRLCACPTRSSFFKIRFCNLIREEEEGGGGGRTYVYILYIRCLLYTSPSPRDRQKSRMPSSA